MQYLIATTFEVVHYIALQTVHYKPLQEVHLSRYNQFKEYINKHTWIITLFWIVVTALITIAIERSSNKIIPDEPIVIKEITDTIIMMHSYDSGKINDSIANIQLKNV